MPKKRYNAEDIIHKLGEAEVLLAQGSSISQACKQLGIADLLPYFRSSISLVKSVLRAEDGHEEAFYGATDCCDIAGRGSRCCGERDMPQAQHFGCYVLHLA